MRGDGVGPEIVESTLKFFREAKVNLDFEEHDIGKKLSKDGDLISDDTI